MSETTKEIRIVRAQKGADNPYYLGLRSTAQDSGLSWEARGVLAYLFSKPDDWVLQPSDLILPPPAGKKQPLCGRDKVYSILKELRQARYIEFVQHREGGVIRKVTYVVHEQPFTAFPDPVEPDTANPHITESRSLQNTDSTKKDSAAKAGGAAAAAITGGNVQTSFLAGDSKPDETPKTPAKTAGKGKGKASPKYSKEENNRRAEIAITHGEYLTRKKQGAKPLFRAEYLKDRDLGSQTGIYRKVTDLVCDQFPDLTADDFKAFLQDYNDHRDTKDLPAIRAAETINSRLATFLLARKPAKQESPAAAAAAANKLFRPGMTKTLAELYGQ